jgi:hypothetical protein
VLQRKKPKPRYDAQGRLIASDLPGPTGGPVR